MPGPARIGAAAILLFATVAAFGEDGAAAWLRYALVPAAQYQALPSQVVVLGSSATERSAAEELTRGLSAMLGRPFRISTQEGTLPANAIILGSYRAVAKATNLVSSTSDDGADRYTITSSRSQQRIVIAGSNPQSELYGAFHLLEEVGAMRKIPAQETQRASAVIRWSDEWDNLNGTIERGYAGPSFFFEGGRVRQDLHRASEYARLLASVGIDGCNINNVNADLDLLTSDHIREFARIADVFRPWGVKLALSVDLTAPQTVGGLKTFDPLDPVVIAWWNHKVDEIYGLIPDFAGFTVKADSEGRLGPAKYGRTPADAANTLARALAPHHGVVLYRAFVYDNHLDWRDPRSDRARAGVDNFSRNDGLFDSNVIIQIKEGPIDFQTREPVSPLFAAMPHTNVAIEVQASQEYTGQQRHMVWLPSMWKWVLDTDLHAANRSTPVKQIVTGHSFPTPDGKPRLGGFVSVTNAGMDADWMHHPMATANLYGFGKLAWNPDQSLDSIIDTWTRLTWGNDPKVDTLIDNLQLHSWQIYEGYTGPNGIGTLTNILGYHFGPGIESAEHNGWGQWIKAEKNGIGMDRTAAGTGFAQQYPPLLAATYESLKTCPDDLLLFFHHVPYDFRLHSGKTLIQSIYDTHYQSAHAAAEYVRAWESVKSLVDPDRYQQVLDLFTFQAGHAIVWRDAIDDWFHQQSQIADAQGRVGHHPNRFEAESMTSIGYEPIEVTPWETASGGKAAACRVASGCSLSQILTVPAGSYNIAVQYFDTWHAASRFELLVNGRSVAAWQAGDTLPPAQFDPAPDGQTATRYTVSNVSLKPGDTLTLKGIPDLRGKESELAPVDYVQLGPAGTLTPQS